MPIDAIKIPQNVYIEDRIVGPLTLRQVLIVTLGGGFSYALWASISKAGVVSLPVQILVWIPAVLSIIFAFVRINDVSMMRLLLLTLERLNKPSLRTWSPRRGIIINIRTLPNDKTERSTAKNEKNVGHIDELSRVLDDTTPSERAMLEGTPEAPIHASSSLMRDISPAPSHNG